MLKMLTVFTFGSLSILFHFAKAQTSARAVFMSTSGSIISENSNEYKNKQQKQLSKVKKGKSEKEILQEIPAGISIEVLKINEDRNLVKVNPSKHKFNTGDKFVVNFETNLPGFVSIYNITPDKRINYLGTYQVSAFQVTRLPVDGEFQFINKKGEEKLQFVFYPCKPNENETISRDISIVKSGYQNGYGNIKDSYLHNLPLCYINDKSLEYKHKDGKVVIASRDIINLNGDSRILSSNTAKYEEDRLYFIQNINADEIKPIYSLIRLKHK